jgi:flagellar export protein FliJ
MKKFRFRFAAVEKVRRIREDEALRLLGQAQKQVQLAQDKKVSLERELASAMLRRERLGIAGAVPAALFAVETDYINGHRQRIIWQDQAIVRAKRGAEKALRAYLLARRHTHVIERLKERDLEQFKRERAKLEQKNLDDITSMRMNLRNQEQLGVAAEGE